MRTRPVGGSYHECPAQCGDDLVPSHLFACDRCMARLPKRLRTALNGSEFPGLPVIARAKLWWSNTQAGV